VQTDEACLNGGRSMDTIVKSFFLGMLITQFWRDQIAEWLYRR